MPLTKAEKQPLTTERLREQLGRLGGTPFRLGGLKNNLSGEVMLPMSELNRLRREVATELETLRAQPKRWTLKRGMRSAERGIESTLERVKPFRTSGTAELRRIDRPRPQPAATRSRV